MLNSISTVRAGGILYNGLYWEAPREFRLQVYERVRISVFEVYERVGKSVISVCKKAQKGLTDAFYGWEKVAKTFWFCDLFIFKRQCINSS